MLVSERQRLLARFERYVNQWALGFHGARKANQEVVAKVSVAVPQHPSRSTSWARDTFASHRARPAAVAETNDRAVDKLS